MQDGQDWGVECGPAGRGEMYIVVLVWRGGMVKYELARVSHDS